MPIFNPGDIYAILCSYINPNHEKYSICINQERALFFWINTDPRFSRQKAQLLITTNDISVLKHDSYIDTGQLFTFPPDDLKTARHLEQLTKRVRNMIIDIISKHNHLTPNQEKMVSVALGVPLKQKVII